MAVFFSRVKAILDNIIAQWEARTGRAPQLFRHDLSFGWQRREQLLRSTAFGLPLITADNITNKDGINSNLVVALTRGVPGFPRMLRGGPFLEPAEIQEITDWINEGALDDPALVCSGTPANPNQPGG